MRTFSLAAANSLLGMSGCVGFKLCCLKIRGKEVVETVGTQNNRNFKSLLSRVKFPFKWQVIVYSPINFA